MTIKEPLRLLMVEDNPVDAAILRRRLSSELSASFEITHVMTLADGLAALSGRVFHLAILDLNLPDSEGLATLHRFKAACGGVPVAVITGVADDVVRATVLEAGAQDVIPKDAPPGRAFSLNVLYLVERTRAQAQHRQIEALLAMMPDAILVVSLSGEVRYVNPAALALFDRPAESFTSEPLGFPVRDGDPVEIRFERRGEQRTCEMRVVRFEWEREPAFLASIRDLTDRLRLEELRARAAELEHENMRAHAANRLKSGFLATMSHELRTPLNSIIGFTELLAAGEVEHRSSERQDFILRILANSHHLLQLINDVLDLAKVESGTMELRPGLVDLPLLVHDVAATLAPAAVRGQVAVELDLDPAVADVHLDPLRLKQILYNYLSNALKFTPAKGKVTVRTRAEEPGRFRIEVEDAGIGIGQSDLGRLFVDFFQADNSSIGGRQGTGLGLALTRRLVEAQGGSVGVRSDIGRGSVFHAVLPRSHAAPIQATVQVDPAPPPARKPAPTPAEGLRALSPILSTLRTETRAEHERIERIVPLLRPDLTLDGYRAYLRRVLAYYEPLERALRSGAAPWGLMGAQLVRQGVAALLHDLDVLGSERGDFVCHRLPALTSPARIWGCLYVIQGSTLGGQVLSRHMKKSLNIEPTTGGAFLWAHGEQTRIVWKTFTAALSAFAEHSGEGTDIVAGARDTFSTMADWLSEGDRS